MHRRRSLTRRWLRFWLLSLVLLLSGPFCAAIVNADSQDERRIRTGARLLRALVAADLNLDSKLDDQHRIAICILGGDASIQRDVRDILVPGGSGGGIRGLAVATCESGSFEPPGGKVVAVFLAGEPDPSSLQRLIDDSSNRKFILFSPFEGHVEKGVAAGVSIEAKVQPYLNQRALAASGVELKSFFVKVAKVHR